MVDAAAFPLTGQSLRTADFRGVPNLFEERFPADPLTVALVSTNADPLATELRDFRNFLPTELLRLGLTLCQRQGQIRLFVGRLVTSRHCRVFKLFR